MVSQPTFGLHPQHFWFDRPVEKHCNRLCLTHRRVTIGSTQRSIEILSYIKKINNWAGIGLDRYRKILRICGIGSDRFWKNGIVASLVNCIINECIQIRKAFWPQLLRSLDTAPLPAPPPAPQASVQNSPDELGSFHGYSLEVLCSQIAFKCILITEPVLKSFKCLYRLQNHSEHCDTSRPFVLCYLTLIVWSSITLQNGPYVIAITYQVILERECGIFLSKLKTCPL